MANLAVLGYVFIATLLFGVLADLVCDKPGETLNTCAAEKSCAKDVEECPSSDDTPTSCPTSDPCESRCVCGFQMFRAANGTCVSNTECPTIECRRPNESFLSCQKCEKCSYIRSNGVCSSAPVGRIGIVVPCRPGCYCVDGYYRNDCGLCVPKAQCPNIQG